MESEPYWVAFRVQFKGRFSFKLVTFEVYNHWQK